MHHAPLVVFVCLGIALTAGAATAHLDPGAGIGSPDLSLAGVELGPLRFGVPDVHLGPHPDPGG